MANVRTTEPSNDEQTSGEQSEEQMNAEHEEQKIRQSLAAFEEIIKERFTVDLELTKLRYASMRNFKSNPKIAELQARYDKLTSDYNTVKNALLK